MSNKTVKHSSRYRGPAGDSRPADEIFDGIEKRAVQSKEVIGQLRTDLDKALSAMTLSSRDGAVEAIKDCFIDWWLEHDIEARKRVEIDPPLFN